jgi:hypothetical protein
MYGEFFENVGSPILIFSGSEPYNLFIDPSPKSLLALSQYL